MAKYFNVEKAIAAGVPREQIDAFIKQNKLVAKPFTEPAAQPQAPAPTAQPMQPDVMSQPSFNERIGQGAINIGKSIAAPFVRTGKNIAGGLMQAPLALRAADLANVVNDPNKSDEEKDNALKELRRVNQLNKLMAPFAESGKATDSYKQDAGQVLSDPRVTKQVKDSVNVASYAVPFGKGANVLTKAVLPGAVVGGMQGASKDDATAASIVGDAAIGGILGGVTYGATKIPGMLKSLGKGTQQTGDKLVQSQMNIPRSTATGLKLPETMSALNRYGYSKVDKIVGGADDVIRTIDDTVQTTVSKAKPVNLDGFTETVKNIVDDPSIATGKDEKILKFVDKLIQKLTNGGKGSSIRFEADPGSTLEVIRTLQKKAADVAKGKLPAAITDEERALKQAYRLISDELEQRLYSVAGADKIVPSEIPKLVESLRIFSPELAKDAAKVTTVSELRSLMAPFVRGKIAAETTELGRNLATETMGGSLKGVGKLVQNPLNIIAMPLGSDTVNAGVGNIMGKAGRVLQSSPQLPQQISNVSASVASRLPSLVEPNNAVNNPAQSSQGNSGTPEQYQQGDNGQDQFNHGRTIDQLTTDVNQDPKDVKGSTGYSYNELVKAYSNAMMEGDSKLANRIKPLMELEKDELPSSSKKTPSTSTLQMQGKAKSGIQAADVIQGLLDSDPNLSTIATVPMVDLFKGSNRKLYEAAVSSLTDAIGGLRTGATVSKDQQIFYKNMLPKPGDSPAVIKQKLDAVRREMNGYLNTELLD